MNMNLAAKPWLIPCIIIVVVVVSIIIILFGFVQPCMKNNWNETPWSRDLGLLSNCFYKFYKSKQALP